MQISKKQKDNSKKMMTFRLSKTEFNEVSNLAEELGLRRSQIVREAVTNFVKLNQ